VFQQYGTSVTGAGLPGNMNHVTGSYPVSYTINFYLPDVGSTPHETAAAIAGDYPGCNLWTNVPWAATDVCVQAIATRTLNNFPAGRKVYVEYANEHWNSGRPTYSYLYAAANLGLYSAASAATPATTLTQDQVYAQRTAQVHAIFASVFAAAGRGSEIVHVYGTNWAQPGSSAYPSVTYGMIKYASTNGFPVDCVCAAPYYNNETDVTDPTTQLKVSPTGGGTTGGSLPAGNYYVYNTFVDPVTNMETTVGSSQSAVFTIGAGNVPQITNLAIPAWGSATANIYLTPPNGAPGTEVLYATNVTSATENLASGTWAGSTSPPAVNLQPSNTLAAALTATHWPTSIAYLNANVWSRTAYMEFWRHVTKYNVGDNFALQHQVNLNNYTAGPIPQFVAYEGDYQIVVPAGVATADDPTGYSLGNALAFDMYYDPATYDWETTFFQFCQQYGFQMINPFFLCGNPYVSEIITAAAEPWIEVAWQSQPFGKGDGSTASNGAGVTNQFWANTQMAPHATNASVRLKAWNDWADAANSFVVPAEISVTPANGATRVSPRVVVVATFNEPMRASSITASTFMLKLGGVAVPATVAYNPVTWTATLTPTSVLNGLTSYVAQLTTGVTNLGGYPLPSAVSWGFVTAMSSRPNLAWYPGLSRMGGRR
jgi:hypothetical protein